MTQTKKLPKIPFNRKPNSWEGALKMEDLIVKNKSLLSTTSNIQKTSSIIYKKDGTQIPRNKISEIMDK